MQEEGVPGYSPSFLVWAASPGAMEPPYLGVPAPAAETPWGSFFCPASPWGIFSALKLRMAAVTLTGF